MSAYSKTIHILEQKNGSLKKELAEEETRIGFLYLDDDSASDEERKQYEGLKAEFQQLMGTLAEIKSLETKKKELSSDIDKVKSELAGLVAKESGLMLTLGIALYGQNGSQSVPSFSSSYEEATRYAEKIASLKTQAEQMTESLELQNVFSRVVTKVKVNSLSVSINAQQKKLDAALVTGAKAVVEAQDLDESLKCPAYETCVAFKNDWNRERIQLEALQDELQNVEVTLTDFGKKSLVQDKADAKNAEIETFAFQAGHAFDKKYITRDGDVLVAFPAKYEEGLNHVLSIRAELASVNRRLDILKYSEQIDTADHLRESMQKEVLANEERVQKLQSQNADLSRRIEENSVAADELRSHREAVEKEEGISVDELLAMAETDIVKADSKITDKAAHLAREAGEKASELAKLAGEGLKKAADATGKAAAKASGTVKKSASKKPAAKKAVAAHINGGEDGAEDDEEAEFLEALNAAKASAAASDGKEAE